MMYLSSHIFISPLLPAPLNMAFNGKWETESQDGYEPFCKLVGIPDDVIAKGKDFKLVTEVIQSGDDFTWIQYYPNNHVVTNKFTIGKESDMETTGGRKFKGLVSMEGGKLTISFPNYHQTTEISGGKLVETSTATGAQGPVSMVRTSRKL
ncbi:hypothetical protein DNTS_027799 [Danionella cerebrum]|uniref:Cytosolic fatty-acid binding proteins domain-containing protein n=1 Tax=Danionella cerebrum TaxID=2873325 RepID=A0A553RNR3_9TELE|nr:hypothetical protein DNTS_027799 [Danionella translucida]